MGVSGEPLRESRRCAFTDTAVASLHNESPVGNSYTYFGEISAEDAAFLQQFAQDVVADFFER
jgi:hypothetical protein